MGERRSFQFSSILRRYSTQTFMPACTHAPARHPLLEQRASDIRIHAAPPSPPLIYFPAIPPVSPGGGAHCGRGMQPHISDSWPAELGAAAARHGSISWERTLACVCVCVVVVFVVFWVFLKSSHPLELRTQGYTFPPSPSGLCRA